MPQFLYSEHYYGKRYKCPGVISGFTNSTNGCRHRLKNNRPQSGFERTLSGVTLFIKACLPQLARKAGHLINPDIIKITYRFCSNQGKVASKATTLVTPSAVKTAEPSFTLIGKEKLGASVHHFSIWSQNETPFSFNLNPPVTSRLN